MIIPKNNLWLEKLIEPLVNDKTQLLAGVYGRQEPLSSSSALDKRDLTVVFGLDERIQKKDSFFHNANSAIPRKIWDKFPFDEKWSFEISRKSFSQPLIHEALLRRINLKNYNFIIFIDDLSFEKIDSDYKIIKSTLDGSIQNQPKNIVLYVTSNRRHLMPRDMIENERSSAIHTDESVEEKISLSDRFGLWIGFHNISQNDFVNIIFKYCEKFKLPFNEKTEKEAIKWSLQRGNRTGRSAWQFIINYAAENNKKIDF